MANQTGGGMTTEKPTSDSFSRAAQTVCPNYVKVSLLRFSPAAKVRLESHSRKGVLQKEYGYKHAARDSTFLGPLNSLGLDQQLNKHSWHQSRFWYKHSGLHLESKVQVYG